ncbi:MoxR family ATPase [Candidatus Cyanaurora vandensis]|uniref:AAA family ATPase n=1 Tax=Candidatus Cyanaurora vandensis TaxID=2714958 RepID=UPI00257F2714|nr:MoxR family ATPase [Candidatus Cyanaurora vandensis]
MNGIEALAQKLHQALAEVIVGQNAVIEGMVIALLADGHVLLEGFPGTAKTLLVKTLAQLLGAKFARVQLTPDVLPSDIVGTSIYDLETRRFSLRQGPVFTSLLLADEINRTPPKTQSALLEAMEERQVTLDGMSHLLPPLFCVVATQNPLEFEGTYPLPEAQLDRFLFKLDVGYPEARAEKAMLLNFQRGFDSRQITRQPLAAVTSTAEVLAARELLKTLTIEESILDYILSLVQASRKVADLSLGASPRAAIAWLAAARAHAGFYGQTFVTPDNVKAVARPLLRHRLLLRPEAELEGLSVEQVIQGLLNQVTVPR